MHYTELYHLFYASRRSIHQQAVGEIALVGYTGLDYASNEPKYTLRFLPGEGFSGLQMMCLMYVGFKRVQPGVDSGIPLDDAYQNAVKLYNAES